MPTIDVLGSQIVKKITPKMQESIVIGTFDVTGQPNSQHDCLVADAAANATLGMSGRMAMGLYKGSILPANLQKEFVYNASDTGSNWMTCKLAAVGAGLDGDNGSGTNPDTGGDLIQWDVDPGDWYLVCEYNGHLDSGINFGVGAGAFGGAGGGLVYIGGFSGNGRVCFEHKITVNA